MAKGSKAAAKAATSRPNTPAPAARTTQIGRTAAPAGPQLGALSPRAQEIFGAAINQAKQQALANKLGRIDARTAKAQSRLDGLSAAGRPTAQVEKRLGNLDARRQQVMGKMAPPSSPGAEGNPFVSNGPRRMPTESWVDTLRNLPQGDGFLGGIGDALRRLVPSTAPAKQGTMLGNVYLPSREEREYTRRLQEGMLPPGGLLGWGQPPQPTQLQGFGNISADEAQRMWGQPTQPMQLGQSALTPEQQRLMAAY